MLVADPAPPLYLESSCKAASSRGKSQVKEAAFSSSRSGGRCAAGARRAACRKS